MDQPNAQPSSITFGPFRYDPDSRLLYRKDQEVALPLRVAAVLESLLQRPGEIVAKDEVLASAWEGAFVGEDSLTQAISQLRQALGDDPHHPTYIQTVPKRGYRFVAQVEGVMSVGHTGGERVPTDATAAEQPGAIGAGASARLHRVLPRALLAAAIVLGSAAVLWMTTRAPAPQPQRGEIAVDRNPRLAESWGHGNLLTISPDGSTIVFVGIDDSAGGEGTVRLYARRVAESQSLPLRDTEDAAAPFFSAAGDEIGFFQAGRLKAVPVGGGKPRELCDANGTGTWVGETIVFTTGGGLAKVAATGGEPDPLVLPRAEDGEVEYRWPQAVPGANAVVFGVITADIASLDDARIDVLELDTGERRRIFDGGGAAVVSPSGQLVYERSGALWAVDLDLDDYTVSGHPVEMIPGVEGQLLGAPNFALAGGDGTLAYVPGEPFQQDRQLMWVERPNRMTPAIDGLLDVSAVEISPSGSRLAIDTTGPNADLVVYDMAGPRQVRQVTRDWEQRFGTWISDERFVFWESDARGVFVYTYDLASAVDMAVQEIVIELGEYTEPFPSSVSPDGRVLAIDAVHPVTGRDLLLVALDRQSEPEVLLATDEREEYPRFSPDGAFIAYQSNASGRMDVYVKSAFVVGDPGTLVPVVDCRGFRWGAEGRTLYCFPRSRRGVTADVVVEIPLLPGREPRFGDPVVAFEFDEPLGWIGNDYWDVGNDGRLLVMIEPPYLMPTKIDYVTHWFEALRRAASGR